MERIAAYSGTKNIYGDMLTSAKSLIANSAVDKVHMFIEDDEIQEEPLPDIIVCHNVKNQKYFKLNGPNMTSPFSYMAMMRIALCHELPNNTVLSLDADTIIKNDCTDIWDIDLDGYYFSSTPELHRTKYDILYCNHGVVYYNLKKLRNGKADECIQVLNDCKFTWVEQDVCNCLCQGYIHEMPAKYNVTRFTVNNEKLITPVIKHFAGLPRNKWIARPEVKHWRKMPWDEVMQLHKNTVERHK